ncbi:hypothetical protein FGIG_02970 [Fasciola gigantica]|uniref:Uncharacterized protein n=1 Tax=Fasciola gigantica TaxID=46835 RepID=A0A504YYF0_FASGI|nr:hypothetical protein FGIG_02970 [Fasciola gigantica]
MESPLGPTLGHIFRTKLGNSVLPEGIRKLNLYRRCVDGVKCLSDATMNPQNFLCRFTKVQQDMKFTLVVESLDGQSSLAVFLSRSRDGSLGRLAYTDRSIHAMPQFRIITPEEERCAIFDKQGH